MIDNYHSSPPSRSVISTLERHQLRSRNINAPLPGALIEGIGASGIRPLGIPVNILNTESSGVFNQDQLIVTFDSRFNNRVFVHATYGLSGARGDTEASEPSSQHL